MTAQNTAFKQPLLRLWLALIVMAALAACTSPAKMTRDKKGWEQRYLDTLFVEADKPSSLKQPQEHRLPIYNPSYKRENDLLHTKLELRFDFDQETVLGKATLDIKPYFSPVSSLTLDAKNFEFSRVSYAGNPQNLKYAYDGAQLVIYLGKTFTRDQQYAIEIEYKAKPAATGGSDAITSNQGLFFINPRGEEPEKPTQIWTQGETEWNSRWFPTIDKPNERSTQEMYITVPQRFKSLSNGVLLSASENADGTRTDHWRLDQPHAPYLFMLAIGEFAVVKDTWKGKELAYFVEPDYEESARDIFAHTPEMLDFFSNLLGVEYPWPKYAQIVVRDYVSGAMENTTAVIFGEFVQKHKRELIDNHNDKIVAHELIHHWFGNLVTCESWANLTLNEGFANYSEYLWLDHKYGRDEADFHLYQEWQGYLQSSPGQFHPLIHFSYQDNEEMFDAHSYNKGGSVLHMLRNYLGDEIFFSALNRYLIKNAYQAVEAHQLRLAFEEASGEDLNWFFNQWYFSTGHPTLNITYGYDAQTGEATLQVEQTQNPDRYPAIFELPVAIDIYAGGKVERHQARINQRVQNLRFKTTQQPKLITFDGDRMLLAEIQDNKTDAQLVFQFLNGRRFLDRFEAISRLGEKESAQLPALYKAGINDPHWVIRAMSLEGLQKNMIADMPALLRSLALKDPHSEVRAGALLKIAENDPAKALEVAAEAMKTDSAYTVLAVGLEILHQNDPKSGLEAAARLENEKSEDILVAISDIYNESGDAKYLPFFEKHLRRLQAFNAISFIGNYQQLAVKAGEREADAATILLRGISLDAAQSPWRRLGATRALNEMRNFFRAKANKTKDATEKARLESKVSDISKMMDEVKLFEPNQELKAIYQQFELIGKE